MGLSEYILLAVGSLFVIVDPLATVPAFLTTHEAIWWNAGAGSLPVGKFGLAFSPSLDGFNGRTSVRLKVLDWRGEA